MVLKECLKFNDKHRFISSGTFLKNQMKTCRWTLVENSGSKLSYFCLYFVHISLLPQLSFYRINRNSFIWSRDSIVYDCNFQNFGQWIRKHTTEKAQRLLLVAQRDKPSLVVRLAEELWKMIWTRGEMIFEEEHLVKVYFVLDLKLVQRESHPWLLMW